MVIDPNADSDVEVNFVAFVDKPAIERDFMVFNDDGFGGPGSGPHPGGGTGDSGGGGDASAALKIPREHRSESDIKKILKTKPKQHLKELVQGHKQWIKDNSHKVGSVEHRTISRELNVADKLLRGFYSLQFELNEEQKIVSGPAMVADSLIYRRDQQGEYNVFFSADTIKQIALKFFKKDYQKNLNLSHDPNLPLDGVTIFESFVSDKSRGIQPMKGFEDLPDGSWFISAKIENDQLWAKIKSGEVRGFSVEGIFAYITKQKHGAEEMIASVLSGTFDKENHLKKTDIMDSVKEMVTAFKEKFFGPTPVAAAPAPTQTLATDYTTKDGVTVSVNKLEVGGHAMVDGAPAPAGDYELTDGTLFTVGDGGTIASVQPVAPADPNAAPAVPAMSSDYSAQFAEINQKFTAYESRFAEQTQTITQLSQSFQKQSETIQGLVAIVEKMADTPTADPVTQSGNSFSTQKTVDKYEKRKELAALLSNLNKNKK